MPTNHDFVDSMRSLMHDEKYKPAMRRTRSYTEAVLVIFILFTAGGIVGYGWRDKIAQDRRVAMENNHRWQLEQMNTNYAKSLETMAVALKAASGNVKETAQQLSAAVTTTEVAADTARKAAETARKAVVQSSAVAGQVNAVPSATRDQVNRSVRQANQQGRREMKIATVLLCLALTGCVAAPVQRPKPNCPPLPELPAKATRLEGRVHWLTVIALYEQCKASQE